MTHWVAKSLKDILASQGISPSCENLQRIENFLEGCQDQLDGLYYICALCGDDADQYLNIYFGEYSRLDKKISAGRLHTFISYVLEMNASKEIWIPILKDYVEMGYYPLPHQIDKEILDGYTWQVEFDPRVDKIIDDVLNANKDKTGDKVVNWLMGQVIQRCKKEGVPLDISKVKPRILERRH